jgi:large subunit ribosomal protein L29
MKTADIRTLSLAEQQEKIGTEKEALRKLQFAHKVSAVENPMKLKETRKLIARLKTELTAKKKVG